MSERALTLTLDKDIIKDSDGKSIAQIFEDGIGYYCILEKPEAKAYAHDLIHRYNVHEQLIAALKIFNVLDKEDMSDPANQSHVRGALVHAKAALRAAENGGA